MTAYDRSKPAPKPNTVIIRKGGVPSFEQLLTDPMEQFDPRSEMLASVLEYLNAPPAAASAPTDPEGGTR